MSTITDTKARIFEAADRLYAEGGRKSHPTVNNVRLACKADMNSVSEAMKEWRKLQTATPDVVAVAVPDAIGKTAAELAGAIWIQATELANVSLNAAEAAWNIERGAADAMRTELSGLFEGQAKEIDELGKQIAAAETAAQQAAELHQAQVNGLTQELQGTEKNLHEKREELAETKGLLSGAKEKIETLGGALSKAESALKTSEDNGKALEQELKALRDKNAELATQLDHATSRATQAENQIVTLSQTLIKAEEGTQAAQIKAEQATAEAKAIDGKLRVLEVREGELVGTNKTLQENIAALLKTLEKPKAEPKPKA